jgi:hypothetical protein
MAAVREDALIPHFLLTGAGFSYNRGGLAREAFDYLLGVTEQDDDYGLSSQQPIGLPWRYRHQLSSCSNC